MNLKNMHNTRYRCYDSYSVAATVDIRIAKKEEPSPWLTCQYFRVNSRWQRSASIWLRSPLSEHLSDIHHLTEKWTEVSTANPDPFPPLSSLAFLLFSIILSLSVSPVHLSISLHVCSMDPALVPGVLSTLILAGNCVRVCQWVHQATGVIHVSLHGDRLHVLHADIQSYPLYWQSCGSGLLRDGGPRTPPALSEKFLEKTFMIPWGQILLMLVIRCCASAQLHRAGGL